MGRNGLNVGFQIRKFVIITTRMCYRSVCNHPFVVGIVLMLLFLYRSSPFLFSLFVSSSPVLVCTAVLLGTLLSFGEPTVVPAIEEEEKTSHEIGPSEKSNLHNTMVVGEDEFLSRDGRYTELRREIVNISDEEPSVDNTDKLDKSETDHDNVAFSSVHSDNNSREIMFEKQLIEEAKGELENMKIEQNLDLNDKLFRIGVKNSFTHSAVKVLNEQYEEDTSAEVSDDAQMRDHLVSSLESQKHENIEDYKSVEGSDNLQMWDQLEPSLASLKQFNGLDDRLSLAQELQDERFEDYKLGEGSSKAQMRDYLESSLRSWKPLDSEQDENNESDSSSDGAESSSPDASLADIIPLLDELHPLLDNEHPQASKLSRHSSNATIESSVKSSESSFHSEDESDQKEEEAADGKSNVDDNEEKNQGIKEDSANSAVMWTEDDQKNLMDLGTSELERNQRLESLIARRRARKMMADNNLIDLDGMDLPFPVAPISTKRFNPFDLPHESYDNLGLPPIPGSAPSVMLKRKNPFDLPYDSSEEKPDLTGDSFQEEFMELTQREAFHQREVMFRRNETFSVGSSAFDFGRPSRFRPYFVPERTDSDVMSYCSLQRQFSELSESKASSATETESTSVAADQDEKKLNEHVFVQNVEASSEIDQASVLVQHGSQSSEDLDILSCEAKEEEDVLNMCEVELGAASSSPAAAADTPKAGKSADNRLVYKEISPVTEARLFSEVSHSDIELMTELVEVNQNGTISSLSEHNALSDVNIEDFDSCLGYMERCQVSDDLNVDIPVKCFLKPASSDVKTEQVIEASDLSHAVEVENNHPKELIYDSSPLMKNHSLSSSSDLQRETSGIDVYQLSRDLFVVEGSNIHNREARSISQPTKQDADDNSLAVNVMDEPSTPDRTKLFSELNQLPDITQASAVTENKDHLNRDLSDREFKDKLLDSKVSSNELEQILVQRDNAETLAESKLDVNRSIDYNLSSNEREFEEDLILAKDKKEAAFLADDGYPVHYILSCSQVESKEEAGREMEVNQQQFQVSGSSLMSHERDGNELLFPLDKNHFLSHDSDIHNPWADHAKQESSIINRKLQEVGQLNKVDQSVNYLLFEEPEHDKLFAYQSIVTSSQDKKKSIAYLAIEEHVQDILETRDAYAVDVTHDISEGFEVDEQTISEEKNDVKEMDEALLSELDAVGDFKVLDMVPNMKNSVTHSTAAVDSNFHAGDIDEVHLSAEMTFDHEASTGGTTFVERSEPDTEITGTTPVETKESNLDSHTENVNIDAGFMKVSKEVQKSVVAEAVQAEFTRKGEVAFPETEALLTGTETRGCASGLVTLTTDADFHSRESIPERIHFGHSFLEGHNLDADWTETDSRMPLPDAEIIEQSGENADNVVDSVGTFDVEAVQTAAETGVDSKEFELPQKERDIKKIDDTPFVEPSTASASEPRDQTEGVGSMEFELWEVDRDVKDTDGVPPVEAIAAPAPGPRDQAEAVGSMEFKSPQIDGSTKEMDNTPVIEASTAPAPEPKDQIEGVSSIKFESLQIGSDKKQIDKTPLIEASTAPATELRDQTECSGSIESVSSQIDGDTEEIDKTPLFERSLAPGVEPRDQAKDAGSMEYELQIDRDHNEIQEPSILGARNSPAVESEYGNKTLKMHILGARIAPVIESENQERNTSVSLLLEKDIKGVQESPLDGSSIESALKSELLQVDREVMETPEYLAHEGIIASASESEEKKRIVGSSEPSQLDTDIPKVREFPAAEASNPSALESEEEKEVGYLESQPLQRGRDLEGLQDWHVVEGSIPLVTGSEGRTEGTAPTEFESLQTYTDTEEVDKSPASQTSIDSACVSEDHTMKVSHVESEQLLTDRCIGELGELPAVNKKIAPAIESEGQLERVGPSKSQQFQMGVDSKEIQDCPVLETGSASDFVSKDQMTINSQAEVVGVQAPPHQQASF